MGILLDGVTVTYGTMRRPGATPLQRVTANLEAPATALVGPSGSGKSTLLRVMSGIQRPTEGRVVINGSAVQVRRNGSPDTRVAMIHQDYRLAGFLTVMENVALGAHARGRRIGSRRVAELLERVGVADCARRHPEECSGGEQQRVAIARSLAADPDVLLADEPTGALDAENTALLCALLRGLADSGTVVVVATHDEKVAAAMDERWRIAVGTMVLATPC